MKKVTVPKFVLIICGITLVLLGFFCGYKCGEMLTEDRIESEARAKAREERRKLEESNQEKEVTDQSVLSKINNSLNIVSLIGLDSSNGEVKTIYNNTKVLAKDIKPEEKYVGIIYSLNSNDLEAASDDIVDRYLKNTVNNSISGENKYYMIDVSKVKELYKNMYDEELTSYEGISLYPRTYFDAETIKILVDYGNEDDYKNIIGSIERYVYSVKEDNNYVYGYVAAGLKKQDSNNCTYYYDIEGKKRYIEVPCDAQTLTSNINKDNYNDFSKYKITFSKKNGNYIFSSIEKLGVSKDTNNKDKYVITTNMKYLTMQNDGGSNTNVYYQIDLSSKKSVKMEDKYVGFEGYEYQGKVISEKTLSDEEITKLKDIIEDIWNSKDDNKDIPVDSKLYTITNDNNEEAKFVDEDIIKEINSLLE